MHARTLTSFILGLGLVLLGAAGPVESASAQKKSKSVEELMDEPTESKKKPSSDDEDDKEADAAPAEEEVAEPDEWEKPPEEEEKAPAPKEEAPVEEPEGDGRPIEVGLQLGWGFQTDKGKFGTDPFGLGFGIRGGYELDFKLYLGVGFQYYIGSSDDLLSGAGVMTGATVNSSANYMLIEAEAGYDLWFGDIIFRPSLWLGFALGAQDPHPLTLKKKTVTDFFFGPGASLIYVMKGMFLGVDLRLQQVTGDGASSIALYGLGGLRF